MSSRELTSGEKVLLREMFGLSSRYLDDVRIHNEIFAEGQDKNTVMAPDGDIYYHPDSNDYSNDFSAMSSALNTRALLVRAQAVFLHESMHAFQVRHLGQSVLFEGALIQIPNAIGKIFGQDESAYEYTLTPNSNFYEDFNVEQQGKIVQDYWLLKNGFDSASEDALGNPKYSPSDVWIFESALDGVFEEVPDPPAESRQLCFLSGTQIDMWDGSRKSIELIEAGDVVASYDPDEAEGRGALKPGRVMRTYRNAARHILDVHGLMVTPGHVTLCGEGRFAGRHVPIIDILRSDGALVTGDGNLVRASTNCPVGSPGDALIWAVAGRASADGVVTVTDKGQIRLGTRFLLDDGRDCSVQDFIEAQGWVITADGLLKEAAGDTGSSPFVWPLGEQLPRPEDYVLARSRLSLNDVYGPGEWEAMAQAEHGQATGATEEPVLQVSPGTSNTEAAPRTFRGEARH